MTRTRTTRWPAIVAASVSATVLAGAAAPAAAQPDRTAVGTVTCEDGRAFAATELPAPTAAVGLVVDGNTVGVAMAVWVADADGNRLAPVWERPGRGLDANTVWCTWDWSLSPTGVIGADLLFSGPRP